MENEKSNLYSEFVKYSYEDLKSILKTCNTNEEKDFYMALANLVLKKEFRKTLESE